MPSEIIQATRDDLTFYTGWILGLLLSYFCLEAVHAHVLIRLVCGMLLGGILGFICSMYLYPKFSHILRLS